MDTISVVRRASSRVPIAGGVFQLYLYSDSRSDKEHIAMVRGNVAGVKDVLVRLHSECFTGDVLGSRRCDCGEQLEQALGMIASENSGVLIYLRQEGRGIGLANKLMAYNLQDIGYDTVDANLLLGFDADERDYTSAALILKDLGVRSIRLLTNNPAKIESLRELGIDVVCRLPLEARIYPENEHYLQTKARRMNHLLQFDRFAASTSVRPSGLRSADERGKGDARPERLTGRPFVTVSYAQSIDGSIAAAGGGRLPLSCSESLKLIHRLRAAHDGILVGIETVITDDPCLTVRHAAGKDPQPVIVDTTLRFPEDAYLLRRHPLKPWIATSAAADERKVRRLREQGVRLLRVAVNEQGRLELADLLGQLRSYGIQRLMVEGGARVITSFLTERCIDRMVVTIAPLFVGGKPAMNGDCLRNGDGRFPRLKNISCRYLGDDMVIRGEPVWGKQ
jgi:3,4-dihydroxy 2-butanone 4-phosphate synthase/GTP cyclohydrolase II